MKRSKVITVCLMACAVVGLSSLVACKGSNAEQYTITGDNVSFYVGGKSVISAKKGETVSIDYVEKFGYNYTVTVKNDENNVTVENDTFEMPAGNVEVVLTATAIEYDVIAPDNVVFTFGVENGKTTVEDTISFTLELETEMVAGLVTVNGEEVNCEESIYSFSVRDYLTVSNSNVTIAVGTKAKTYDVNAPAIVSFKNGVVNGKTERANTIEFFVNEPVDCHLVSVMANGQMLTGNNDIYSFVVADMLQTTDNIEIVIETEEHTWETTVVEATCTTGGYTLYACDCGVNQSVDEKFAKNLIADIPSWYDGLQFTNVGQGIAVTQTLERGWDAKRRVVVLNLEEEKYLSIDFDTLTAASVLVQFSRLNGGVEDTITIYPKQSMQSEGRYVFSLQEDMGLTENGTYYLTIFIEGPMNTGAIFREVALLAKENEQIHEYSIPTGGSKQTCYPSSMQNTVTVTCKDCGFTNVETIEGSRFLLGEPTKWHHGGNVAISYNDYKATLTLTNEDAWGWASRIVNLKTTDYICFTATGKFKLEIGTIGELWGTVLLEEKAYNGERMIVPVSNLVKEDGEYIIFLYVIEEEGVEETVSEFFILSSATEEVHAYDNGECTICGKQKEND